MIISSMGRLCVRLCHIHGLIEKFIPFPGSYQPMSINRRYADNLMVDDNELTQ